MRKAMPNAALAAMWEADMAAGINPTDGFRDMEAPSPVVQHVPLVPPELPPADWRAEQVVASLRSEAPEPEPPTAEALQARPARRRRHWERPR